jgi:predicted nucleic acid-binding protein
MRAAVDASPLIYLTRIGRLDVLDQYEEVLVPPEVLSDAERSLQIGHPEALDVRRLVEKGRLRVRGGGKPRTEWNLDRGEAAVLTLALKAKVDEVVTDDRAAIGVAKYLGLRPVGVPFLLLRERRSGRLSQEAFEASLRRLLTEGYYLSPELHHRLVAAGRA